MSKIYGAEKIRRTCVVKGREHEGRFALLRQSLNISKVLAPGAEGEGEDVDTALVSDVRISPRPPRQNQKVVAEAKSYPADKPIRRACFVAGRPESEKYHLLRRGAEQSKVLKVGEAGTGEWIPTSAIVDEHFVPVPTKPRFIERKPVRLCKLNDTGDQEYLLLRKTDKLARLVPVYDGNYGITIDPARIIDERVINQGKKKGKKGDQDAQESAPQESAPQGGEPDFDETVTEQPIEAQAEFAPPVHQPVAAQPAPVHQPAAAQVAPVQHQPPAPVQQQPRPAPTAPVQQQPRPAQPAQAPRPAQPVQQPRPAGAPVAPQARPAVPVGAGQGPRPQPQARPAPVR